jgi:hypothetical protein
MDIWAESGHDTRMALALVGLFECRIMISNYKSFAAQSRVSYSFPWYPSLPFLADRTPNLTQIQSIPSSKPFPNRFQARSFKCQCRIIQIDSHACPAIPITPISNRTPSQKVKIVIFSWGSSLSLSSSFCFALSPSLLHRWDF